ncbi:MAG: UDP-N-acetylglucosamine 2-epimerase (non-hydrolyzing) [Candidatus Sumerlaeia bacterium]|nr:UDP-N-acetylglucosamine 2-epimerase (non-hydrolyzing) [Candidatus Sumerlaeia bacterium]
MKIVNIVGARPNFMKIAPLMEAYRAHPQIEAVLVHTGQHYDERMSDLFFRQLGIPKPTINLGIGSGSHAVQTAEVMKAFERVVLDVRPDAVLVVGDVNSTIACGLVAVKLGVRLIHVEAGLRSGDRTMPEEINRILTDAISDQLFCTEQAGVDNLLREGQNPARIHLVGNVMIDTLLKNLDRAQASTILSDIGIESGDYAVLTLHRPSNVDDPAVLRGLFQAIAAIQRELPVVFPIHPRTRARFADLGMALGGSELPNVRGIDPVGYLDFLKLMAHARVVLTDSGGIQEETTILKVPCLTLRENTERPITAQVGSNRVVGTSPDRILAAFRRLMDGDGPACGTPPLWDGRAAERIVDIIAAEHAPAMAAG